MPQPVELYILDTNILLLDPECIHAYPGANIIIPISVIEELDLFKHQINDNGRHSRRLINMLDELRRKGSLFDGVKLENKTILSIWTDKKIHPNLPSFIDISKNSNRVLSSALAIKDHYANKKIVLITNDMNLRIKASLQNISAISYREEKNVSNQVYELMTKITLNDEQLESLEKYDYIQLENTDHQYYPNQQVLITNQTDVLCRYVASSNYLIKVSNYDNGVWNIQPKNLEQKAALDILLNKKIDIVILAGKAGTGKTLLALAAALESVLNLNNNRRILVSRPIVPLGKDIGYLPGDIEEKITPWMQPIYDNLELLMSRKSKKGLKFSSINQIVDKKIVELEALTYIRGRSISNRYMIVDEAQNLTPHEVKTIITRSGENTKLVLTGDPYQIDNPYVDLFSNGLTYVIEKLKPFETAAHAYLVTGERSRLAELASNVL